MPIGTALVVCVVLVLIVYNAGFRKVLLSAVSVVAILGVALGLIALAHETFGRWPWEHRDRQARALHDAGRNPNAPAGTVCDTPGNEFNQFDPEGSPCWNDWHFHAEHKSSPAAHQTAAPRPADSYSTFDPTGIDPQHYATDIERLAPPPCCQKPPVAPSNPQSKSGASQP